MAHGARSITALRPGAQIGTYRIIRLLGRGGMATVYLARDMSLGRPVALKFLSMAQEHTSESVDQFLVEARATARFNHPNVVTLFGAGQHGEHPFVALEYVEGETLRERLRQDRATLRDVVSVGLGVARAIVAAHDAGVLHRDLKPTNVLLSKDGRVRVLDFGIARLLPTGDEPPTRVRSRGDVLAREATDPDDEEKTIPMAARGAKGAQGTPAYMAPEQWSGFDSRATDLWALGMILYEMIAGKHPYTIDQIGVLAAQVTSLEPVPVDPSFRDVPTELTAIVMRCLAKDPAERPSARDVVDVFSTLDLRARSQGERETNPFRALTPFRESDADVFFGRDEELERLVERLRHQAMLLLIGPSGVGKSSLVRAGLIPRLREQGNWTVIDLRPGPRPLHALSSRLLGLDATTAKSGTLREALLDETLVDAEVSQPAVEAPAPSPHTERKDEARLVQGLRDSPRMLSVVLNEIADRSGCRVLLLVDQLEEAQALAESDQDRQAFFSAIFTSAMAPEEPVRVVATLRDDFLGRIEWGEQGRAMLSGVERVSEPSDAALRETILRPLRQRGYAFDDPGLVDQILDSVRGESACLPLLQFALSILWNRRDAERRRLLRRVYEGMGALAGALADHAERVLSSMPDQEAEIARVLFLRLVTPEGTRRVVRQVDLLDGLPRATPEVLSRLVDARLLNLRKSSRAEQDVRVEIAHESLPSMWQRMARWMRESRQELVLMGEVTQAAELWERRGRRTDELWEGRALEDAERMLGALRDPAPPLVHAFVQAAAMRETNRRRVRRALLGAFALLATVAVLASSVAAWTLRERARHFASSEARARADHARILRDSAWASLARRDVADARGQLRSAVEIQDALSLRALWQRLLDEPLEGKLATKQMLYDVDFAPKGMRLAAASQNRVVYLFDPVTLDVQVLRGHDDQVLSVAFRPDGGQLLSASWSGQLRRWDLQTGSSSVLGSYDSPLVCISMSPDGKTAAAACREGGAILFDTATGKVLRPLGSGSPEIWTAAFDPGGARVALGSADGSVRLVRTSDGTVERRVEVEGIPQGLAFAPGGNRIAVARSDGGVLVVDLRSGAVLQRMQGHDARVRAISFLPDGKRLVSAGHDEMIRFWGASSGRQLAAWPSDVGWVLGLRVHPSGRHLAVSGTAGVALYRLPSGDEVQHARGRDSTTGRYAIAFSADGRRIAAAGHQVLEVRDARTGELQHRIVDGNLDARSVAFSRDGKRLLQAQRSGLVSERDLASGRVTTTYGSVPGDGEALAAIPERDRVIAAGGGGRIVIWVASSGERIREIQAGCGKIWSLAVAPDATRIVSGSGDGTVRLWDVDTWQNEVLVRHDSAQRAVAWLPDGRRVASVGEDGRLGIIDVDAREERLVGQHGGRLYDLDVSPDGKRLAVSCSDGNAYVWDVESGRKRVLRGHRGEVNCLAFSPDGERVVTTSDDGTVRFWLVHDGRPAIWGTPMLGEGAWRYGHDGWQSLAGGVGSGGPKAAWAKSVERAAFISHRGGTCLADARGELEFWAPDAKTPTARGQIRSLRQVVATDRGCVALTDHEARWVGSGPSRTIVRDSRAAASTNQGVLVVTSSSLLTVAPDGNVVREEPAPSGVTAVQRTERWTAWGYREGTLEVRRGKSEAADEALMKEVGRSPVSVIAPGPEGMLLAGFEEGLAGVWDVASGQRMHHGWLHGAVIDAVSLDDKAIFVTDLGDRLVVDLRGLRTPYCQFLQEVWRQVPYAWVDGRAVQMEPPRDHPCNRGP